MDIRRDRECFEGGGGRTALRGGWLCSLRWRSWHVAAALRPARFHHHHHQRLRQSPTSKTARARGKSVGERWGGKLPALPRALQTSAPRACSPDTWSPVPAPSPDPKPLSPAADSYTPDRAVLKATLAKNAMAERREGIGTFCCSSLTRWIDNSSNSPPSTSRRPTSAPSHRPRPRHHLHQSSSSPLRDHHPHQHHHHFNPVNCTQPRLAPRCVCCLLLLVRDIRPQFCSPSSAPSAQRIPPSP